jgi:tryptophan synthase beta subunit
MKMLGAEVRPALSGSKTKDATNEAATGLIIQ